MGTWVRKPVEVATCILIPMLHNDIPNRDAQPFFWDGGKVPHQTASASLVRDQESWDSDNHEPDPAPEGQTYMRIHIRFVFLSQGRCDMI